MTSIARPQLEPPRSAVLEALRRATAQKHHHLESLAINTRLLRDDYRIDEYRDMLQRMYGFYEPLAHNAAHSRARCAPTIVARTERLRRDLLDLRQTTAELEAIQRCRRLPSLATSDRELGCAYVFEGAALGGRVISKHLVRVFQERTDIPMRFFSGDGEATATRWRTFCAELDANANNIDHICVAACVAFDLMAAWLARENERAPSSANSSTGL